MDINVESFILCNMKQTRLCNIKAPIVGSRFKIDQINKVIEQSIYVYINMVIYCNLFDYTTISLNINE